jgi:hypothetical protein
MREFQRWKGLMSITSIKTELNQERADLLSQMIAELNTIEDDFNVRTGQSLETVPGMERPPQTQNMS